MNSTKVLERELREAEAELDAATRRTELNAAAKRLMRAKPAPKRGGRHRLNS